MKHVAVLNQFALPRTEGGGTRHIDLFSRLEGWTPLIIAGNRNHSSQEVFRCEDNQFRLVSVPAQKGRFSRLAGWLVYTVQTFLIVVSLPRLDMVYASTPHLFAPLAGLFAARIRRVPFILEVRDLWPESLIDAGALRREGLAHRGFRRLERYVVTHCAHVVAVSEGWDDHFAALGLEATRLTVIPNGTEPIDLAYLPGRDDLRAKHSVHGFTAVFAGAHGPKDGIDLILDAAEALPDVNFLLVGAGSAKASAMARAARESLRNVEFRTTVAKCDLPGLLGSCDVGIHAVSPLAVFEKGMSPNKVFDYMASGLPVVSNAQRGLRTIMIDGECGHLGGSDSLSDCLRKVRSADPELRGSWGRRAQLIVRQRYSRSGAVKQLERVLRVVASATGKI